MFVIGNLMLGITKVLDMLLTLYMWVIVIRALISWVNPDPYNPIVQFLQKVTEPVLRPLRKLVPTYRMGIDLSPLIAILIIYLLKIGVIPSLERIADAMR